MQYRDIEEFELYEINEFKEIRHKVTKNVKLPHRGGTNIRLYESSTKTELSRKIDKLFDKAFPELVEGIELPNLSKYKIRKNGDVYSKYEAKVLKPANNKKGYLQVSLIQDDGQTKSLLVHRLVAMAFLEECEDKTQVNHIDGNKKNNHVNNLEWCTGTDNLVHAVTTGLYKTKQRKCVISLDGIEWIEYNSFAEAARELECNKSNLRETAVKNSENRLNNNVEAKYNPFRCKGYIVKYVDDNSRVTYNTTKKPILKELEK